MDVQDKRSAFFAALTACTVAWSTRTIAATQMGQPAVWHRHDLIVSLSHLPQRYSCDNLWYKFRDVLLALGARPNMKILVYRCGARAGTLAYSPRVHLQFAMPELLNRAQARWGANRRRAGNCALVPGPGRPHFEIPIAS
jgi:hypothetical protein